jgi:hypothetical protein
MPGRTRPELGELARARDPADQLERDLAAPRRRASGLLAGSDGRQFRERWLRSVYAHVRSIVRNLSAYSSANNHLIGEAAGIWIAATTWPYWRPISRWGARARNILEQEILAQNAPDGGNREQAIAYQQFVLDFLLLAGLAARAAGEDFSPAYWQRVESMVQFLASLMDVSGNVPMIGDAADGYVVRLARSILTARSSRRARCSLGALTLRSRRASSMPRAAGYRPMRRLASSRCSRARRPASSPRVRSRSPATTCWAATSSRRTRSDC